jgi:hypothetical protein
LVHPVLAILLLLLLPVLHLFVGEELDPTTALMRSGVILRLPAEVAVLTGLPVAAAHDGYFQLFTAFHSSWIAVKTRVSSVGLPQITRWMAPTSVREM